MKTGVSSTFAILTIVITTAFLSSCASEGGARAVPSNSAPAFSAPTPAAKKDKPEDGGQFADEKLKALNDFVEENYKGWKINGVSSGEETHVCIEAAPCDLQLTKTGQTRIATLVVKRFYKSDNSAYWVVYEARAIDAASKSAGRGSENSKTNQ